MGDPHLNIWNTQNPTFHSKVGVSYMGLFGKLKSGLSSAAKHLKTVHFRMSAGELAENWGKLHSVGSVYISFKEKSERYELESVYRTNERGKEIVEIWYLEEIEEYEDEEEEVSNPVYESQRKKLEPKHEVWIHMSEAQYEKLIEKHGDFLKKFET